MEANNIQYKGRPLMDYLDRVDMVQLQSGIAMQKIGALEGKTDCTSADIHASRLLVDALQKSYDTTQKLIKELVQEIKDLREEGRLQQEQIEEMHKKMEKFKDNVLKLIEEETKDSYPGHVGIGTTGTTWTSTRLGSFDPTGGIITTSEARSKLMKSLQGLISCDDIGDELKGDTTWT